LGDDRALQAVKVGVVPGLLDNLLLVVPRERCLRVEQRGQRRLIAGDHGIHPLPGLTDTDFPGRFDEKTHGPQCRPQAEDGQSGGLEAGVLPVVRRNEHRNRGDGDRREQPPGRFEQPALHEMLNFGAANVR
jgi:hypothetical protein